MAFQAIRPTVTHRVRGFLATQGVEVKPWAPLDETYASLYRLMSAKRDDAAFWGPVQALLGEIVADATGTNGRLPAPQAELLKGWDIEELVRDLRRALPNEAVSDPSAFKRFSAGLSAPVLGGFLLFGVATTGCDENTGSNTDTSWAENCSLEGSSGLWKTINDTASLTDGEKADLCACFAGLNQSWTDGLNSLFESASPSTVASYLEAMINCCDDELTGGNFPDQLLADFCDNGPADAYKGVAFPENWGR
ncbi:MAG: hypothetical protein PHU25_13105 [Deltaproteobacteria bacterium]|nr:hypothetical protein [Deltaproteobacteria bacterium]